MKNTCIKEKGGSDCCGLCCNAMSQGSQWDSITREYIIGVNQVEPDQFGINSMEGLTVQNRTRRIQI